MYVRYVLVQYAAVCLKSSKKNDIRPHTVQEYNERTSTEFSLVTAHSTAHEPPEDGRIYGPRYVGASFLKCFKY